MPASRHDRFGDLRDIRHVMILMQENRSFDHYFGSLRGVRGFGDRAVIRLPGGAPVWRQPDCPPATPGSPAAPGAGSQYPWPLSGGTFEGAQPPTAAAGAQNFGGTDHSWQSQHAAWHGGLMDGWQRAKGGPTTLGFLTRADLPFYYALADAYTIGDAYHCSVLGATGPNRAYLWSGTINADQQHGAFVAHAAADYLGDFLPWECYPVTLERAGLSWKVYQGSDNYGDNGAQYFAALAELDPSQGGTAPPPGASAYYDNGLAVVAEPLDFASHCADNLANAIEADVRAGTLPQVSWVVTNQRYSEHPNGAPADGEYYVGRVLRALNADPAVFNSTLVIINYDENDGQFDHVPPPVPVAGTAGESYLTAPSAPTPVPAGLGFRVPLLLVSPWTRGGWVTSEVCDHSSVLQFLERWSTAIGAPASCPNISGWRRSVCGDLLAAFDFESPVYGLPDLPFVTTLTGDAREYRPVPAGSEMPAQEPGSRPARPVPCQPNASLAGFAAAGGPVTAELALSNAGPHVGKASHFSVYDNTLAAAPPIDGFPAGFPGQHTVAPSRRIGATTTATAPVGDGGGYDITVVGPNRFLRRFAGTIAGAGAGAQVTAAYYAEGGGPGPALLLTLANGGGAELAFTVTPDRYPAGPARTHRVPPGQRAVHELDPVATAAGWYDLTVTIDGDDSWSQRFTGHLETGQPSVTG
jgi:phospholipase C